MLRRVPVIKEEFLSSLYWTFGKDAFSMVTIHHHHFGITVGWNGMIGKPDFVPFTSCIHHKFWNTTSNLNNILFSEGGAKSLYDILLYHLLAISQSHQIANKVQVLSGFIKLVYEDRLLKATKYRSNWCTQHYSVTHLSYAHYCHTSSIITHPVLSYIQYWHTLGIVTHSALSHT